MLRREFLASFAALAATPALSDDSAEPGLQLSAPEAFHPDDVINRARELSQTPYKAPRRVPDAWTNISYEDYVSIWFDVRNALWRNEPETPLQLDVFSPGLYFPHPIDIAVVEKGMAQSLKFDFGVFDKTDKFPSLPTDESLGYSGLRLRAELETPSIYQEFAVFQGASYFRAIGTGNIYGQSARGLAINTADPEGEEFPDFRAFWLEKPGPGDTTFVVHALLDSPSCTGAYRFEITPGLSLTMDVTVHLFPREDLDNVGIAPLTSMFQYDQTNRHKFSDFRPAVHDTDGLLMVNGAGETIWRPLANPSNLQISAFQDENPQGFGLMQRARNYNDFADLQAHYHKRPGVWIEPNEDWGQGSVTLVEIPTQSEIYDNIVCYWRPSGGIAKGTETQLSYRLTWGAEIKYGEGLTVLNTMIGSAFDNDGIIVVIDFENGKSVPQELFDIDINIGASAGEVSSGVLQRNPETDGPRLAFKFFPGDAQLIEFRAQLRLAGDPLSEVWLYRWTA
ncbi:glucan biosynthesis protein [Shimia sp. MMG029]|uniref:glucan biosynthesis protein n=1 Tax=Shimia sp. MMG029 TaxID=3021978 RepID=UPI0022FECC43|nr:glucan biosynthesis protein G [Shimia sp. MMG029]MDA5559026.1 glucan biosynthesis protein G [Shimia sp. MMG029]